MPIQRAHRYLSHSLLILLISAFHSAVFAAEGNCQIFRLQGSSIEIEAGLADVESGSLANMLASVAEGSSLSLNFPDSEICVSSESAAQSNPGNGVDFVINSDADEVAVKGSIDGSLDVWLRLDASYDEELLLVRSIGEATGLADMEFLSDNSGVGAEDFFAEQLGFLQLGSAEIDAPFAEVPRFGVEYDHYEGMELGSGTSAEGSLGLAALKNFTLIFDSSSSLVYFGR